MNPAVLRAYSKYELEDLHLELARKGPVVGLSTPLHSLKKYGVSLLFLLFIFSEGETFHHVFSFFLFFSSLEQTFFIENFVFTHFETSFFYSLHYFTPIFFFKKKNFTCLFCHFISSFCSSSLHLFFVSPCSPVSFTFFSFAFFKRFLGLLLSLCFLYL